MLRRKNHAQVEDLRRTCRPVWTVAQPVNTSSHHVLVNVSRHGTVDHNQHRNAAPHLRTQVQTQRF